MWVINNIRYIVYKGKCNYCENKKPKGQLYFLRVAYHQNICEDCIRKGY